MEVQVGNKIFEIDENILEDNNGFLLTKIRKYDKMNFSIKENKCGKCIFEENDENIFQEIIMKLIQKKEIDLDNLVKIYINKEKIDKYEDLIKIQEMFIVMNEELKFFGLPTVTFSNIKNEEIKKIFKYGNEINRIINEINKKIIECCDEEQKYVFTITNTMNENIYDICNVLHKCLLEIGDYEIASGFAYRYVIPLVGKYGYDESCTCSYHLIENEKMYKTIEKYAKYGQYDFSENIIKFIENSDTYEINDFDYITGEKEKMFCNDDETGGIDELMEITFIKNNRYVKGKFDTGNVIREGKTVCVVEETRTLRNMSDSESESINSNESESESINSNESNE